MSAAETCRWHVDAPTGNSDAMSKSPPLTISYDLYRAIEDLRSVPVLRRPDQVTFNDITCDVVDRTECNGVTTNASRSGDVVQSELSYHNHTTTTTITTTKLSTISSGRSYVVQTDYQNTENPPTVVDGDPSSKSLSLSGRSVSKPISAEGCDQSSSVEERTSASDAGNERVSDSVFADVATPIDADLLIDDVYEREMDELDRLDNEATAFDDPRDWLILPPPESMAVDGFDKRRLCTDSTGIHTDGLIESSTDRQFANPRSCTTERNALLAASAIEVHRAKMHPQSVRVNTSSSFRHRTAVLSRLDASAEEVFEEIVESLTDTVSEDDAELDELTDREDQLVVDALNTTSVPENTVDHRQVVEKFVEDNLASPVHQSTWTADRHSIRNDKKDTLEQKRQEDLTVCLASTLTECLNALSEIDTSARRTDEFRRDTTRVGRYRKYDVTNGDVTYTSSSTRSSRTNSLGRQCVTSSSSGFQSDLMDVDIEEEFDANVAFDAVDLEAVRSSAAESTSLDSLLEENDDDELYSSQTILRRPASSQSKRSDKHSVVDGFVEKPSAPPQTTVRTEASVTAVDKREDSQTVEHDKDDGTIKENGTVVAYDEKSERVEVLDEELITQEIVLNIVLPRRSKENKKRAGVDGCTNDPESAESGVIDRRKSNKTPHRDFHIHRVVRCADAGDRSDNRLAISEPQTQKSVTESAEKGSAVNGDDSGQLELSGVLVPGQSLVSSYVGGPVSVEVERNAESATTEEVDEDTRLHVTHRNRVKVLRVPDGSGTALFNAPVASIRDVVNDVGRTLVGDHQRQPLPPGARVTCDAVQRKSSSSLPDGDVTVIRRTIVDDSDRDRE